MSFPQKDTIPLSPPPQYGFNQNWNNVEHRSNLPITRQPAVIDVTQVNARQPWGSGVGKTGIPLNKYQVGLCDVCHDMGNLCYCLFLPCCLTSIVTKRLDEHCCYPCMCGVIPLSVRFRSLNGIEQTMCQEGCTFCCCGSCALLRLVNEMEERQYSISRS